MAGMAGMQGNPMGNPMNPMMMQHPGGMPMQPQPPQMPAPQQQQSSGGQQQQQQQQQQVEHDPITKFKMTLLPRLKEALLNLFKDAGQIFKIHSAHDSGSVPENQLQQGVEKFEKRLEDFCSICDQIEICLRLGLELHHQAADSLKNTPQAVIIPKSDTGNIPPPEGQSYAQYLTVLRQQINCAKEVHDLLHEHATRLTDKSQPQLPPPAQPHTPHAPHTPQSQQQQSQSQD